MTSVGDLPDVGGFYWHRRPTIGVWEIVRLVRDGYWTAIESFGGTEDLTFFSDDPGFDMQEWEWSGPLVPPES